MGQESETLSVTFTHATEVRINGRHVTPDTELTVKGVGRVRFKNLTITSAGVRWIDCIDRHGKWRSFDVDRVTVVHRVQKGR